jgi:hypothetical protein
MDCTKLKNQLAEAEDALHRLNTGAHEVSIRDGDKQTTYSDINHTRLLTYIDELKAKVAECEGRRPSGRRMIYLTPR